MTGPQVSAAEPQLRLHGILDAGVPNRERVAVELLQPVNLGGYGLVVGIPQGPNGILPIHDNVFWMPQIILEPPSWVVVFTDRGEARQTTDPVAKIPVMVLHWQRETTIFQHPGVGVGLIRVADVVVAGRWVAPPDEPLKAQAVAKGS